MKRIALAFIIFALLLIQSNVAAKGLVTFEREYSYKAGITDNLVSCRMIALEQVKLLLLEELGTYLESETEVKNFSLTQDKITVLTAGIVRTTIIDEKWDNTTYYLKARIVADPEDVTKKINDLRKDRQKSDDLFAARKIYDSAHMALRAGKIDESEILLKKVIAEYPATDYAKTGNDQLVQLAQIRQFEIQRLDQIAQVSIKNFHTLLLSYIADMMKIPSTINDLKLLIGDNSRMIHNGVRIFYLLRQKSSPGLGEFTLYAFHEAGQKVYLLRSEEGTLSDMDKNSGILTTIKKDYKVLETSGQITFLGER